MRRLCTVLLILAALAFAGPVWGVSQRKAESDRWFEWSAVAPEVVVAKILGKDGRAILAVTEDVLKGNRHPGEEFLIDQRKANRERMSHESTLRLLHGESYLLLLEPSKKGERRIPLYNLSRGVQGARILPAEGARGILDALRVFLDLHKIKDYDELWKKQADLLESTNPLVLQEVLAQFIKFRRGDAAVAPAVLPLVAHPSPRIRTEAATLLGQILEDTDGSVATEQPGVSDELIAMVRGDAAVSARVAAAGALSWIPGERSQVVLKEVATKDPDQLVRYTAQKFLLRSRDGKGPGH